MWNLTPVTIDTLDQTDPAIARKLAVAMFKLKLIGLSAAIETTYDTGIPNGGDGGGTIPEVQTDNPHGLIAGEHVVLSGTPYDGEREVEPTTENTFQLLNTPFTSPSTGGTWSPKV